MVVVRTRWTGGGSRLRLTEVIVYSLLFVVVPPRLASYSSLPRALPRLPCVERRGPARVAKLITLSCSRLPRRLGGPQHDRRGAYFVHHTACGAGFLGLSSAQNTSLSRRRRLKRGHIRVMQRILGWTPRNCSFGLTTISLVAVPVLAPWRAICWELVMRGSFSVWEGIARDCGPLQALCKESRDRLIKSKSGTTRAPHCATTPQCCYGIAGWPRGHPQQNPRPTGPKKQSRPTPPKGTPSKIATPQVPVNTRNRLPQARPRST